MRTSEGIVARSWLGLTGRLRGSRSSVLSSLFALSLSIALVAYAILAGRNWTLERAMVMAAPEAMTGNSALAHFAMRRGSSVFSAHCATCHGPAGKGDRSLGVPDLTDRDYLYGAGTISEIEDIARHGIRAGDRRGRNLAFMPAYATVQPYPTEPIPPLSPPDVRDVVQMLLMRSGHRADPDAVARGQTIFLGRGGCYDCHGADGGGDPAIGAPSLIDPIWQYGDGSPGKIAESIEHGRRGYSPAYADRLSAAELRAVAVYVAALSTPISGTGK